MDKKIKQTGKFVLRKGKFVLMLAGILILALLIRKAGVEQVLGVFRSMSPYYICLALVPWILTLAVGAYRLKHIVGSKLSFFEMFRIYIYGYLLNYASPIQGFGAGAKIAMLKMKNVKFSRSSASVSSEIAYDILFTAIVAAVFFLYHVQSIISRLEGVVNSRLMIAGAAIIAVVLTAMWLSRKSDFVREFFSHLGGTFMPKRMMYLFPATIFTWVLPAAVIYLFFAAIGAKISFLIILGSISIGFLLGLASFVPGGIGIRDAITAYIYSISGLPIETTISIAIFNRFFTIGTVMIAILLIKGHEMVLAEGKAGKKGKGPQ